MFFESSTYFFSSISNLTRVFVLTSPQVGFLMDFLDLTGDYSLIYGVSESIAFIGETTSETSYSSSESLLNDEFDLLESLS